MSYLCETKDGPGERTASGLNCLVLTVHLGQHIPSKKNHHFPGKGGRVLIDKKVKERILELENAILCELFSLSAMLASGTPSACSRPLRTLLSELCDDSIREIPSGSWGVRYVKKGQEGVEITIMELPAEIAESCKTG